MPLHARKMLPPVRELIEELALVTTTTEAEDVYEREPGTGHLIRVGQTKPRTTTELQPTGKLVESFETTGPDGKPVRHEGSMKQVDLHCSDCGSLLKPANDRDFYYLLCSRLNERRHEQFGRFVQRATEDGVVNEWRTFNVKSDEPYEFCVLECDNEPHEVSA